MNVTTHRKGKRIGVSVDGLPVGLVTKIGPSRWTTAAYAEAAPFERHVGAFDTEEAAVSAVAEQGRTPDYMKEQS